MTLERTIEARFVIEAQKLGLAALKFGMDGWPDRLVVLGKNYPGAVLWVEFKNAEGRLRPNQVIRHKQLTRLGQTVVVCRSVREALGAVAKAQRSIDRTKHRD